MDQDRNWNAVVAITISLFTLYALRLENVTYMQFQKRLVIAISFQIIMLREFVFIH